ncbi:MAG: hypothetical protein IKE46_00385 [Selenomonadaceae bacterium]|nr:hypothetical protein [Selenomonadaceae bacterium]
METYELEEEMFSALADDTQLISLLPSGAKSIFHYVAPATFKYPAVVYSPISDVPTLNGDNREIAHRVTIRVHVITKQDCTKAELEKFREACGRVKRIMVGLGFHRVQTTPFVEDGKSMLIFDFIKGVRS